MNKSITQAPQNDKQISKSIKRFFTRFHISSALKAANAYKRKGTPVTEIFQYMFLLIFSNRSMYMSLLTGKNTPNFAKATLTWAENVILCPMMQWLRIPQLFSPDIGCCHWKAGNPMIPGHLGSSFYTFLTKSAWTLFYYKFFCPKEQACFRNLLNLLPRVTVRAYVPGNGSCRGFAFKYGKFLLPPRFLTALSVPKVPTRKQ